MSNLVNVIQQRQKKFKQKAKLEKNGLFSLGPKYVFLTCFLKDCAKKGLKIYN